MSLMKNWNQERRLWEYSLALDLYILDSSVIQWLINETEKHLIALDLTLEENVQIQSDKNHDAVSPFDPPIPVALKVGCVAAVFCPPGCEPKYLSGTSPYSAPRMVDPLPQLSWPR